MTPTRVLHASAATCCCMDHNQAAHLAEALAEQTMANKKPLSAKQQAVLDERLARDAATNRNASTTVWELIMRKVLAADELSRDPLWKQSRRFAALPNDQIQVICLTGQTAVDGIFAPDCIGDGILRRFALNSPLELALRLSIGARYHWAKSQWNGNSYPEDLFRPILQAVAARDFTAADQLAQLAPPVIAKPNNRSHAAIFQGVAALMRKDRELLHDAVGGFKKGDAAYIKSIGSILAAAANNAAADFAEGMNKLLSAYRRYMYGDELYGLIDPHAMGLYELCKQFSAPLVDQFDIERGLPWDQEYYAWSQQIVDISVHFDVEAVPEVMLPFLFRFEPIPWGKGVLANWNSA